MKTASLWVLERRVTRNGDMEGLHFRPQRSVVSVDGVLVGIVVAFMICRAGL